MHNRIVITILTLLLLVACSSVKTNIAHSPSTELSKEAKYGIIPFSNHTTTPMAGQKATAMLTAILHSFHINQFVVFNPDDSLSADNNSMLSSEAPNRKQMLAWAKQENIQYLIIGSVNEWRYKVGLDGEPVASMSLHILQVSNSQIISSAAGSKKGSSRSALSAIGQELIEQLLQEML